MINSTKMIVGVIVVVLVGAGIYVWTKPSGDTAMVKDAMMETDGGAEGVDKKDTAMMDKAGDTMMKDSPKSSDTIMKEDAMMKAGTYEAYAPEKIAQATTGKVLLFFYAPWCPLCRATEADINAHLGSIPGGVHILKVDYDTATDLKQRYGVTMQTTFVQVDGKGNMIQKWSGQSTLKELVDHLK